MIRIVLADDQELVRTGLRALAEHDGDIEVVAEAVNGRDAVAVVRGYRPDVVLMDIRMPILDGIAATREIVADPKLAGVRVVVLTTFDEDENVFGAIRAGPPDSCSRTSPPPDCGRPSAPSPQVTRCSLPRSPGGF
ncbi:response regulator [Nocardia otitidiscaviarum]|uniref:response regulator n=1 Tax=Nocardia otitidiscaviarum TaxID=1823 RepID=UPI000ACE17E3